MKLFNGKNYQVKFINNNCFSVYEKTTRQNIHMCSSSNKARDLVIALDHGHGFDGFTPSHFANLKYQDVLKNVA